MVERHGTTTTPGHVSPQSTT